MFIPDPGYEFFPSRIPDPKFFLSRIPGSASKNFFNPKIYFLALRNTIRVVHPGSGSWFFTHPGSRGSKRHRMPDLQHCLLASPWRVAGWGRRCGRPWGKSCREAGVPPPRSRTPGSAALPSPCSRIHSSTWTRKFPVVRSVLQKNVA